MKKSLTFEIPEVGYFPADIMSLSILSAYNDTDALLYGFYNMFGNYWYHEDGKISLNAEWNWECPLLCRKLIPRITLENCKDISLINYIVSCIDAGYYVYITLDQSKISCYKGYGGPFSPHPLTIYGYDDVEKIFYMADFTDGLKYRKEKLTYNEFVSADKSIHEYMKILSPLTGTNEWILDIELVKYLEGFGMIYNFEYISYQMELFLMGRSLNGNLNSIHKRSQPQLASNLDMSTRYYEAEISDEFYGINVLKEIVRHLQNCLNDSKYIFNFRHVYLIWAYTKILMVKIDKLAFIFKNDEQVRFKDFLIELEITEKELNLSVKLSLKYGITTKQDILNKAIRIIQNAIIQIEKTNKHVIDILRKNK